jgi:predicted transcriptional regulator
MSKETMGKDLDLSKQTIMNIINSLLDKELIQKSIATRHLRVTSVFMEYLNDYKKFTNNTNNKNTFIRPTAELVNEYSKEIGFTLDASQFIDHYEARGWLIGKNPMKDWKAAVRTWKRNSNQFGNNLESSTTKIKLK